MLNKIFHSLKWIAVTAAPLVGAMFVDQPAVDTGLKIGGGVACVFSTLAVVPNRWLRFIFVPLGILISRTGREKFGREGWEAFETELQSGSLLSTIVAIAGFISEGMDKDDSKRRGLFRPKD